MKTLTIDGASFDFPETGDKNWGDAATDAISELADKSLFPSDVIDDLVSDDTDMPLSAAQGKALAGLITALDISLSADIAAGDSALDTAKADKVSGAINDHLATLDAMGNLKDGGIAISDLSTGGAILKSQTIDTGVSVNDPVYFNITKELIEACNIADFTDSADMTTSVNTSISKKLNAINLVKDGTAGVLASTSKTVFRMVDFTSKELSLSLYIADQTTLDYLEALSAVIIKYGSSSGDYYQWNFDNADLKIGWNALTGMTSANADSTVGTPSITDCNYIYIGLTAITAGTTWAVNKIVMDAWTVLSDKKWKKSGTGLPTPAGVYIGNNSVCLSGYADSLIALLAGYTHFLKADGSATVIPGEAYNGTKIGYAISDTEMLVDVDVEGNYSSISDIDLFPGTSKGFYIGGDNGSKVAAIEDIQFTNGTSSAIVATLDTARSLPASVMSGVKGYVMGGNAGSYSALIDDLNFSDQTSAQLAATLDAANAYGYGVSASTRGYKLGGYTGSPSKSIENLIFQGETSAAIVAQLDTAINNGGAVTAFLSGYTMGGHTGSASALIQKFLFSGETPSTIAATLDSAKYDGCGFSGISRGYHAGGAATTNVIENLIFTTETSAAIVAVLSSARYAVAACSSVISGYTAGGYYPSSRVNTIEKFIFSDETCGAIAATLDGAKSGMGAVHF